MGGADMGYSFTIGNATPRHSKEYGVLSAGWEVNGVTQDDAPNFPNDGMTGKSNERSPSYSAWADFCRQVGITELFYDERQNMKAGHPGCQLITDEDLDLVRLARMRWQAKATLPPGFAGMKIENGKVDYPVEGKYDHQLARILWLEWWMSWALANCDTPAIQNT